MDTDLVNTIILYAPGVAILVWTHIKDRELIDKLMDKCVLREKNCHEELKKELPGET